MFHESHPPGTIRQETAEPHESERRITGRFSTYGLAVAPDESRQLTSSQGEGAARGAAPRGARPAPRYDRPALPRRLSDESPTRGIRVRDDAAGAAGCGARLWSLEAK